MAHGEYITDLDAVDLALGGVIASAYHNLAPDSTKAFRRFLERPDKEKILKSRNDDIQATLERVARQQMEPDKKSLDLPLVIYYRDMSVTGDQAQFPQVLEVKRYVRDVETEENTIEVMRLSTFPITLTYSMVFLAWDRVTTERMILAWWGYLSPRFRKHSRFLVWYRIDGELVDVQANISSPREVATSFDPIPEENGRLWGSRTMIEVNTQALYAAKETAPESASFTGSAVLIP